MRATTITAIRKKRERRERVQGKILEVTKELGNTIHTNEDLAVAIFDRIEGDLWLN